MIIFIHGDDTFRSRQYLHKLKAKYLKEIDTSGGNLTVINGEKTNLEEINNAISTASLLVTKRMVIIENLLNNKSDTSLKEINIFLQKDNIQQSNSNIVIIWDSISTKGKLPKLKKDIKEFLSNTKYSPKPFNKLSDSELSQWIISTATSKNSKISNEAANTLCIYTQNDLWLINNELEKLIHFKTPNPIEVEDVKNMVISLVSDNIFALTDAIGNRNKTQAINLLENQLEAGANEFQILSMITKQFKTLARIKVQSESGLTLKQIANITKLHPFVVQKSANQAKNYTYDTIKGFINKLTNYDHQAKTGKLNSREMLEMLILTI